LPQITRTRERLDDSTATCEKSKVLIPSKQKMLWMVRRLLIPIVLKGEEWINTPVKWHLIIRWIPAVFGAKDMPGNIRTEEEAIYYTVGVAKELKSMVWLVLSRKNIHVDSDGNIKLRNKVTKK